MRQRQRETEKDRETSKGWRETAAMKTDKADHINVRMEGPKERGGTATECVRVCT